MHIFRLYTLKLSFTFLYSYRSSRRTTVPVLPFIPVVISKQHQNHHHYQLQKHTILRSSARALPRIIRMNQYPNMNNQYDEPTDDNNFRPVQNKRSTTGSKKKRNTKKVPQQQYSNNMPNIPEWMRNIPTQPPPSSPSEQEVPLLDLESLSLSNNDQPPIHQQQKNHQQHHHQMQQQHILLLVGLPGSGKTTLATTLCRILPWKYEHVNQDILKTRQACIKETQRIINNNKCPIIDRCNVSIQQRQYFANFTRISSSTRNTNSNINSNMDDTAVQTQIQPSVIPVDCIVLKSVSVQTCIQRCKERTNHPTLTIDNVDSVLKTMKREWQEPKQQLQQQPQKQIVKEYNTNINSTNKDTGSNNDNNTNDKQSNTRSDTNQCETNRKTKANIVSNKMSTSPKETFRNIITIKNDTMLYNVIQSIIQESTGNSIIVPTTTATTTTSQTMYDNTTTITSTPKLQQQDMSKQQEKPQQTIE